MTVTEVKTILNIAEATTTFDDQIEALLDDVIDSLESETNRTFDLDEEGDKVVPGGLKKVVAYDVLQLLRGGATSTDISSIKLGDYTVSYSASGMAVGTLTPAKRDRIVAAYTLMGAW